MVCVMDFNDGARAVFKESRVLYEAHASETMALGSNYEVSATSGTARAHVMRSTYTTILC